MNTKNQIPELFKPINQLNLFGYKHYFDIFARKFREGKLSNSILLSGQKGIGKATFAYHFINYLLSQDEEDNYNLNSYSINPKNNSFRQINDQIHPNFFLIKILEKDKDIKIDQIRNLNNFLSKSSYSKELKFVLIDNSENLNLNSANALLKNLEEPSDKTMIILIHDNSRRLLETISSRCVKFNIHFNKSEKRKIFSNISESYKLNLDIFPTDEYLEFVSPGYLLQFLIKIESNFDKKNFNVLEGINFFMENYKNEKNIESLYYLSTLIQFSYRKLFMHKNLVTQDFKNYDFIINSLNDMRKFSLDEKNILISIKDKMLHETK
tara:strand:- start:9680 stop:10651 length:972 start_codon:yes stop_codon:yes gene_type:complete